MENAEETSPEATLGYFVPEQEFIKLYTLRDQLTLLATFAAPRQKKFGDVIVSWRPWPGAFSMERKC